MTDKKEKTKATPGSHVMITFVDLPLVPPKGQPYVEVEVRIVEPGRVLRVQPFKAESKILQGTPFNQAQVAVRVVCESDPALEKRKRHFLLCPAGVGLPRRVDAEEMHYVEAFLHPTLGIPFGLYEIKPIAKADDELADHRCSKDAIEPCAGCHALGADVKVPTLTPAGIADLDEHEP